MGWPKGRPFSEEHRAKLVRTLDSAAGGRAGRGIPKSTPENMRVPKKKTPQATIHPTTADLHWAAGFLEGEGSFSGCMVRHRNGERRTNDSRVFASQLRRDPLEKLAVLFGGPLYFRQNPGNPLSNKGIWTWSLHGSMARGVMMTLYLLLSQYRRSQIKLALVGREL